MGIRFFCPQGHKLNVKAELAGKVGICPKCGERMLIPLESTREPGQKRNDSNQSKNDFVTEKAKPHVGLFVESNIAQENLDNIAKENLEEDIQVIQKELVDKSYMNMTGTSEIGKITNTSTAHKDSTSSIIKTTTTPAEMPFRQSTSAPVEIRPQETSEENWYVRGADDKNYGPVSSQVVQAWINEKRIGPNTLVWHEGWDNWQEGKNVFPELHESNAIPYKKEGYGMSVQTEEPFMLNPSDPIVNPELDLIDETAIASRKISRKKKAGRDLAFVLILIVMIALLSGVLIFILVKQNSAPKTPAPAVPAAKTAPKKNAGKKLIDEEDAVPKKNAGTKLIDEEDAVPKKNDGTKLIDEEDAVPKKNDGTKLIDEEDAAPKKNDGTKLIDEEDAAPKKNDGTKLIDEEDAAPKKNDGTKLIDEEDAFAP